MLAGATDYHLGGFRALPRSEFKIQYVNPRNEHTLPYVGHVCGFGKPSHLVGAIRQRLMKVNQFEVLRTVPGTWDEIRVPLARMNEHVGGGPQERFGPGGWLAKQRCERI